MVGQFLPGMAILNLFPTSFLGLIIWLSFYSLGRLTDQILIKSGL